MTRINKYLAECGVASRRAVEDLIRAGKITINGKIVTNLSTQITDTDKVAVDGKPVSCQSKKVYIMLNKPAGVVTTCDDQFGRKTVMDLLYEITERVYPVGRLDYDTEGLLILTNDGEFAKKVTHPSSEIPKTYDVTTNKTITPQQHMLLRGGAGFKPPREVRILQNTAVITITEGKNRQVRKMFESVGLRITHLKRIAIGSLTLGDLGTGEWRHLSLNSVSQILRST